MSLRSNPVLPPISHFQLRPYTLLTSPAPKKPITVKFNVTHKTETTFMLCGLIVE